jgi:ParB family chromosome partitioning protein
MSDISEENSNKKQRLGRGLGSLLGGAQTPLNFSEKPPIPSTMSTQNHNLATQTNTQVPEQLRIWQIAIDKIAPSAYQPRTHFQKEKLEELASSIKQNGILQPIVARKLSSGKYEIIAGERRWRAAQLAGLHEVPVIFKVLQNQAALEVAIIENIQREDLNAIEEAEAYQRLIQEFQLTQQQVADKVGKDRATVANALRLLGLPNSLREMVAQAQLSPGHAKVLLGVTNPMLQKELAQKVSQQRLSVRQLEKLIAAEMAAEKTAEQKESGKENKVPQKLVEGLAEQLQKSLGTKVNIDYADSKGRISIHFYSDEELTQIVDRLKESHGRH